MDDHIQIKLFICQHSQNVNKSRQHRICIIITRASKQRRAAAIPTAGHTFPTPSSHFPPLPEKKMARSWKGSRSTKMRWYEKSILFRRVR